MKLAMLLAPAALLFTAPLYAGQAPSRTKPRIQQLEAHYADALRDLNEKEKATIAFVRDDKSLTPTQLEAKLAEIRADFNAMRKKLDDRFRDQKRALAREAQGKH